MADSNETPGTTRDIAGTTARAARRSATARTAERAAAAAVTEDRLEDQIARLQDEIKAIGNSLARLSDAKIGEARSTAKAQYRTALSSGRNVVDELSEQVNSYEGQLVEAIRERPLTAVAGAIGVGFLIALLSRR
jgi:ElaB/YqjD/DUF883 family membrane-anchored ribosome-binding protein